LINFDAVKYSAFLNDVASLPERKKNDGKGRAANAVAEKYGVSVSTVYQARTVIKNGQMILLKTAGINVE